MAVTGNKKQQEGKIQSGVSGYVDPKANGFNGTNQQANPYSGMVGVSANTAQHVGQAQQGYQQGANVTAAQQILQQACPADMIRMTALGFRIITPCVGIAETDDSDLLLLFHMCSSFPKVGMFST